jgi:hypothetical protein
MKTCEGLYNYSTRNKGSATVSKVPVSEEAFLKGTVDIEIYEVEPCSFTAVSLPWKHSLKKCYHNLLMSGVIKGSVRTGTPRKNSEIPLGCSG